ncbi:hypothetical protein OG568_55970 (plasmid) [Streptomyces sp. NBC_01450]|uniref:hypothetical protein n=1 Tax=Streptomyces sp. NBC_01450 TaxID=2903871 RepID=UPI002E311588|nr:hypothetical protein [Streptomyces sp. NBC_01450]
MSRQPFEPTPAEREEMARLLPVPADRDLPGSRHRLFKDYLMTQIQPSPAVTAATAPAVVPARPRRRSLALVGVPLAVAAAVGAVGTFQGTGHSGTGQPLKVTAAAYTIQKGTGGVVRLAITDPARKLDLSGLQHDLARFGIRARAYGGELLCPSGGPFEKSPVPLTSDTEDKIWQVVPEKGDKTALDVHPDGIPTRDTLLINFPLAQTDPDHAGALMQIGLTDTTPPTCGPALPKGFVKSGS